MSHSKREKKRNFFLPRLVVREHRRHRVRAPRQRLPQHQDVRADAVVVAAEHPARPGQPGLDLVGNQQRVVLLQQVVRRGEVPRVRDDDAGLALRFFFPGGFRGERKGGKERKKAGSFETM